MAKLDWDDSIDEKVKKQAEICFETLHLLNDVKFPRWTHGMEDKPVELISFCDASGDAYAAVIYSRIKVDGEWKITLLAARGRVTPLKTRANVESKLCTVPKLELEGILLLTELYKDVSKNSIHR